MTYVLIVFSYDITCNAVTFFCSSDFSRLSFCNASFSFVLAVNAASSSFFSSPTEITRNSNVSGLTTI